MGWHTMPKRGATPLPLLSPELLSLRTHPLLSLSSPMVTSSLLPSPLEPPSLPKETPVCALTERSQHRSCFLRCLLPAQVCQDLRRSLEIQRQGRHRIRLWTRCRHHEDQQEVHDCHPYRCLHPHCRSCHCLRCRCSLLSNITPVRIIFHKTFEA